MAVVSPYRRTTLPRLWIVTDLMVPDCKHIIRNLLEDLIGSNGIDLAEFLYARVGETITVVKISTIDQQEIHVLLDGNFLHVRHEAEEVPEIGRVVGIGVRGFLMPDEPLYDGTHNEPGIQREVTSFDG